MALTKASICRSTAWLFAALLFWTFSGQTALAAGVLLPSGPWSIDYATNECRLLRAYGTGDEAITLRLARGAGLESFDMLIAGKSLPELRKAHIPVKLRLDPGGAQQEFDGYIMAVPGRPERFVRWYDGDPEILDAVTDSQQLEITVGDKFVFVVDFAKAAAALRGLNHCHAELLKGWGIDPARLATQKIPPKPRTPPYEWVRPGDYPTSALAAEKGGTVLALLTISAAGKATDCRVMVSSNVPELDQRTCQVLRSRASYHPAKNATGQEIVGIDIQRVRWLAPDY